MQFPKFNKCLCGGVGVTMLKVGAGCLFDSCIGFFFLFFVVFLFKSHLLRPYSVKRVFLPRDPTRPDLPWYTMKLNDFYVVLIGIERHEEITSLFYKSTSQS